jgi:hypothetical protein
MLLVLLIVGVIVLIVTWTYLTTPPRGWAAERSRQFTERISEIL